MQKLKKIVAIDRMADTTQMISNHFAEKIGFSKKTFSSRLRHSQQVANIASIVATCLGADSTHIWNMALWHDFGHRVLGHQSEEFIFLKINELYRKNASNPSYVINRAVRHEANLEYSLVIHDIQLPQEVIEAGRLHSGERKARLLIPGRPVTDTVISDELVFNRGANIREVTDFAPQSIEACIIRICDPLTHIADDGKTLIRLKEIKGFKLEHIPTVEDLTKSFIRESSLVPGEIKVGIEVSLFERAIEIRSKIEEWQKTPKILELRAYEQDLLKAFWEIQEEEGKQPEEIIDIMNTITETEFLQLLKKRGVSINR